MSPTAEAGTHGTAVETGGRRHNEDPPPSQRRTWRSYGVFARWMSHVYSIGGYAAVIAMARCGTRFASEVGTAEGSPA